MAFEDIIHPYLGTYTRSPQWVKSTLGWAYSRLPKSLRWGRDHAMWRALAGERRPQELAREAEQRLRATLTLALTTVPAYQRHAALLERLERPFEALAQLPIVSKLDIKREPQAYLSSAIPPARRLETFTGGSTANPMRFFLERHVTRTREYGFIADFQSQVGYVDGDVVLSLRGRTVPTAATGGAVWMYEPIKRQLMLSTDHLSPDRMPDYVEAMRRFRPVVVEAFASALYPLAKWLRLHPAPDVVARLKGVLLYSESIPVHQVELFREVFPCPVLRHYGHSERVLMAMTLPDDDRYFFWPQYGHLELVDDDDRPVTQPGAVGEIVGTSFDNRVMPFIRYRTGDLGVWSARIPHPAYQGFPVLERIDGRRQEMVVCRDGRLISITTLGAAHFNELAQVQAIQYEQHAPGRVRLNVETTAALPPKAREHIAQAVREKTQGGCEVEIVEVDRIARTERGKQVLLIQHLDLSHEFAAPQARLPVHDLPTAAR
jgi:phenylacetate-CoA ligase